MTAVEFLTACLMVTAGYAALLLSRLHDARRERDLYRFELSEALQRRDIERHRAEALASKLIAAHVAVVSAENAMADAFDQRDDMQRRLAAATWPEGASNV